MFNFPTRKAFTLAEIMIALTVIGVITSILLPVAFNNVPNENVMKFKKGNATLAKVINELVTSEKYYKDGDLGSRTNDELEYDAHYFCSTVADVVSVKNEYCDTGNTMIDGTPGFVSLAYPENMDPVMFDRIYAQNSLNGANKFTITSEMVEKAKAQLDVICKEALEDENFSNIDRVVLSDNSCIFEARAGQRFASAGNMKLGTDGANSTKGNKKRFFSPPNQTPPNYYDQNGMDIHYKVICLDIDITNDDEDPFGYGVRADGKILLGKRAEQWSQKSLQDKK